MEICGNSPETVLFHKILKQWKLGVTTEFYAVYDNARVDTVVFIKYQKLFNLIYV